MRFAFPLMAVALSVGAGPSPCGLSGMAAGIGMAGMGVQSIERLGCYLLRLLALIFDPILASSGALTSAALWLARGGIASRSPPAIPPGGSLSLSIILPL